MWKVISKARYLRLFVFEKFSLFQATILMAVVKINKRINSRNRYHIGVFHFGLRNWVGSPLL